MNTEFLFERDMLYPTENYNEPGSVHIKVSSPNKNVRIPVIIESKTTHSPVRHLDSIVRIMQSDIFDRIFIDVKKSVDLFIKTTPELKGEYGEKAYIHVTFEGERTVFTGVDAID